MGSIVVDRVGRRDRVVGGIDRQRFAVLRVGFIQRCAGAGDRDADPVPAIEDLADPTDVEIDSGDFTGLHQDFAIEPFAVTDSLRVIDDQDRATVGIDVADADDHVGVGGC